MGQVSHVESKWKIIPSLQHNHTDHVVATLHAHLTHDLCLEVIVLRGPAKTLREIAA